MNPETGKTATISSQWSVKRKQDSEGTWIMFTAPALHAEGVVGVETGLPESVTIGEYASAFSMYLKNNSKLKASLNSAWQPKNIGEVKTLYNTTFSDSHPGIKLDIWLTIINNRAWRVILFTDGTRDVSSPAITSFAPAVIGTIK